MSENSRPTVADVLRLMEELWPGALAESWDACGLVVGRPEATVARIHWAVDPVSAANIRDILHDYVGRGGTVIVSSHVMDLVQRMCSHVAVISDGVLRAAGTLEEVRAGRDLEERFVDLVGGRHGSEGLAWL